jgi:hypothetical protein
MPLAQKPLAQKRIPGRSERADRQSSTCGDYDATARLLGNAAILVAYFGAFRVQPIQDNPATFIEVSSEAAESVIVRGRAERECISSQIEAGRGVNYAVHIKSGCW